jgi:hypothetical protein
MARLSDDSRAPDRIGFGVAFLRAGCFVSSLKENSQLTETRLEPTLST